MTRANSGEPDVLPTGGPARSERTVKQGSNGESRPRILVSFDIDGTMEFGDPPGPVSAAVARELVGRGYIVGVASDWPRSSQQPLWSRHGVEPEFVGGKHHLHEVKAQFAADRYVHVGDTDVDERYALLAGFEFLHVDELVEPVVADDIHDGAWVPPSA